MITETGQVVAESGSKVWVMTIRQSACQSCSARHGCGQKALATMSQGKANQILVDNTLGARVGDQVTLAIGESALLGASLLVYALPLLLMVAGAMAGHWLSASGDLPALAGAVAGLAVGFASVRRALRRSAGDWEPRMTAVNVPSVARNAVPE